MLTTLIRQNGEGHAKVHDNPLSISLQRKAQAAAPQKWMSHFGTVTQQCCLFRVRKTCKANFRHQCLPLWISTVTYYNMSQRNITYIHPLSTTLMASRVLWSFILSINCSRCSVIPTPMLLLDFYSILTTLPPTHFSARSTSQPLLELTSKLSWQTTLPSIRHFTIRAASPHPTVMKL